MAIQTIADAVGIAKVLYRGRDPATPIKWDWWCEHLGLDKTLAAITADDLDEAVRVLM